MAFALKGASPSILGHQVLTLCGDGIKLTPHLTLVASSSTLDPTLLPSTVLWFSKLLSFQVNRWPGGSGGGGICEPHCVCFDTEGRHCVTFTRSRFSCSDSRHYRFQFQDVQRRGKKSPIVNGRCEWQEESDLNLWEPLRGASPGPWPGLPGSLWWALLYCLFYTFGLFSDFKLQSDETYQVSRETEPTLKHWTWLMGWYRHRENHHPSLVAQGKTDPVTIDKGIL